DMDTESQRAIAVWAVFVVPFVIFGGFLYIRDQLTLGFIGLYWFPPIALTMIGTIPPPWDPLRN
ncbi:MAG: hypothetical protein ABEJ57_01000, partial [Halobacteriaceae archaeon]